jgi:lysine 6-dehydrogenase
MGFRYAVLGAGRQGTAAGFDMARFGDADEVWMTDFSPDVASAAAERINRLIGGSLAHAATVDASDRDAVVDFLRDKRVDAFLSAVPYFFNLDLTRAAIEAGSGMTDLGGNSDIVLKQLDLSEDAADAGVTVIPDCGQVPGMGTSLVLYAMEQLDEPQDVFMWDCGLPQKPEPPWNYRLTFSIEGLTNEYFGDCLFIRDGKLAGIPALTEHEVLDFPEPIGTLEGFTTSGGLTSAARSFAGQLRTLQNKTLRYPGNFEYLKTMERLGLLEVEPISVDGQSVVPRHVLHTLWDPQIRATPDTRDFILIRILATGLEQGQPHEAQVDLVHFYDETLGFTAMEQATGWHAAIMTEAIAMGRVPQGAVPVERALTGAEFVAEAQRRGFDVKLEVRTR